MLPKMCFKLKPFNRVWSKVDGPKNQSGRSLKWTVLSQTGRSFEPKWTSRTIVDGLLSQTGRSLGINLSIKVNGPKVSNWTVKLDGL